MEQYPTEGDLAARWLLDMNEHLALFETRVVDLGAGNGILGLGTLILGARSATLVEADPSVAEVAQQCADEITREYGGMAEVLNHTIDGNWPDGLAADIIVMNPPWGYQTSAADRPLIEAALASPAHTIHLLHSAAASHPAAMARDAGWSAELRFEADFRLPANMAHHTSKQAFSKAAVWRFQR